MIALDVSNYTSPLTAAIVRELHDHQDVGRLIIQAFPPSYPQYAEQRAQMRACAEAGVPFDIYIYDYHDSPWWVEQAAQGVEQASERPHQLWSDEEEEGQNAGLSVRQRTLAVDAALRRMDAVSTTSGQRTGVYTRRGYWETWMANTPVFADRELWDADYDGLADTALSWTPYGGWASRAVKQFRGTSVYGGVSGVDVNVLSPEEAAETSGQEVAVRETPEDWEWPTWYEAAINLKGIADELGRQAQANAAAAEQLAKIKEIVNA